MRERSLGSLQGVPLSEAKENPELSQYLVSFEEEPVEVCIRKKVPDGECILDVANRLNNFLSELDFNEESTIAIVSHFHTLRTLLYLLQNKPFDKAYNDLMVENSSPILAEYRQGCFEIKK